MRGLLILAGLLAAAAPAAQAADIYARQPTWAASMLATRRNLAQTPMKEIELGPWHATDPMPAESVADPVLPDDEVDLDTRVDGQRVLHGAGHWQDGHVHGLGNRPKTVRYLFREIQVRTPGPEEIQFSSEGPFIVWVNGAKVAAGDGKRPCKPGQQTIRADLRNGRNVVLVKIYTPEEGGAYCFEMPGARLDRQVVYATLYRTFWDGFPEMDWFIQDNPYGVPAAEDLDPRRDFGWYFEAGRDSKPEQQMIGRALAELGRAGAALAARLDALVRAAAPVDDPAWLDLYVEACRARRQERLKPLLAKAPRIIFTKHYTLGGSHYAYTEGQSDAQAERYFIPRAALCLLEWDGTDFRTQALVDDPKGIIRDPDVSYDGRRVLFSWKKSDRQDDYHLYEIEVATREVRQITDGLGVADYEGAYLPSGDILFNSTRCVQTVDCWWTEVSNLYRCDHDGRFLRRLTFDQVHDNFPTVTEDGRILYTRWEYNDRGQIYTQPLLQMSPDGTNQTEFYGVNSWFPTTILHARGVPGSHKVLAIATGHHSRQTGKLIVVDQGKGLQENTGVQLVAPPRRTLAERIDGYGQEGELFQYPYPLSETECLVTYHPVGWPWSEGQFGPRFGIYFMTLDGRRERLVSDARLPCSQPIPLRPRATGHSRPSLVDYRKTEGTYYVQDVYAGPGLKGVPRGTIKTLRVVALDYRAAGIGSNGNSGPGGGALICTPVAVGNGSWDPKIILGDATVRDDGSAYFRAPARVPVYFQLLDAKGRMVQTMRSWSTLQPGENAACVGCHEQKNTSPLAAMPATAAMRSPPDRLKPFYGEPRGFSFAREIQPILNRHCTRCHDDREAPPPRLTKAAAQEIALPPGLEPILPIEGQWQYTTDDPGDGWQEAGFDSSRWPTGAAGFGTRGTPGGKVVTEWRTKEIWLRRSFTLPADWRPQAHSVVLRHCHDEDIAVYVNGAEVFSAAGHITQYEHAMIDATVLRPGKNVVAVNCRQTVGGQFIDVGILAAPIPVVAKAEPAAPDAPSATAPPTKKAFSLLDTKVPDDHAKRAWTDAYLALTHARPEGQGEDAGWRGDPNHPVVNWVSAQSAPPMLPPNSAGANRSRLIQMLDKGHEGVKLSPEEMDKIVAWIDLGVPFCGDYYEANLWDEGERKKYDRYLAKRQVLAALDRQNIEALVAFMTGASATTAAETPVAPYRNVALNPHDVQGEAGGYPHASSNSEFGNSPCFAARCAIDGKTDNKGHGDAFPSWGPDRRKDLWWKVEFGRKVEVDKIVLTIRADFPHDSAWKSATIEFSDGSREKIQIAKTADPQTFTFAKRTVTWLRFIELVQDEPLGWCGFSEVEVWGRDVTATATVASVPAVRP